METLLTINGVLVSLGIYLLRQFHLDFKKAVKSMEQMNYKFIEHVTRSDEKIQSIEKRQDRQENEQKKRA